MTDHIISIIASVDIFQIFQRHLPLSYFSFGNVFADFQDCLNIVLSSGAVLRTHDILVWIRIRG
jgi:hypothetical protein